MKKMKMKRENSLTFEQGCQLYLNNCRERNLREGTLAYILIKRQDNSIRVILSFYIEA
jgi:hypothetical protein